MLEPFVPSEESSILHSEKKHLLVLTLPCPVLAGCMRHKPTDNSPTHGEQSWLTWKTVTMAHNRESKFFRSGIVSPVSVLRLNLQPKMCIPRMLLAQEEELVLNLNLSVIQVLENNAARPLGPIHEEFMCCKPIAHHKTSCPITYCLQPV